MNDNDIILTGVPRSGTTLACLLLSKLPDVVALNEPMRTARFRSIRIEKQLSSSFRLAVKHNALYEKVVARRKKRVGREE